MASNPFDQFDEAPDVQAGNIGSNVYGFDIRQPHQSELQYFKSNPNVAGMAAEDGRVILNPHSKLNDQQRMAVAKNEAARLWMRSNEMKFDFDVTPEQLKSFAGTDYAKPENEQNLKHTIIARAISGDQSAGNLTRQQKRQADEIQQQLVIRETGATQGGNPFDQFDEPDVSQEGERRMLPNGKEVGRALGLTARTGLNAVAAIPLMAADAGIAARNLLTGSNYDSASSMWHEGLDAAGLPRPETAVEKGTDFIGQVLLGGKLPLPSIKNAAPNVVPVKPTTDIFKEGEKHGVPVFFDDVTNSPLAKKAGVLAENFGPLGTAPGRATQNQAAKGAAEKVVSGLATGSDDVPQMVQAGLKRKLEDFRGAADVLYKRAATALDGNGDVPTSNFQRAVTDEITKQEKFGPAANNELISTLRNYRNAPAGNFSYMQQLRSQLGGEISKYYGGNKAIGDKGVESLKSAKDALDGDLAGFAQQAGGSGYRSWKQADAFYKTNLVPFKEAGLKSLVRSPEPEKAWQFLISQGSVQSRSDRMYRALDNEGRAAVRYGLAKDALSNAANPNGSFSPAKFAKYMEDHENAVNTFFRGRDLKEIQGFSKLMRSVERAGQVAENPPTGQRLFLPLLAGGAYLKPDMAAVAAGSSYSVKLLFQTERGRNLLLQMADAKGPALKKLSERAAKMMAQGAAVAETTE